jgi:hypothetical protein
MMKAVGCWGGEYQTCQRSSGVEQRFRKPLVVSSNLTAGCFSFKSGLLLTTERPHRQYSHDEAEGRHY